ncbi:MAG: ankyrin repeat domain-containing protein [Wolbachia endosymbiont of Tyrophagus putrescentiae]|nr:ankyrin repeat domain-containing protein [Wolbachia endosymbiont of Tyrophagus putrescentiae]
MIDWGMIEKAINKNNFDQFIQLVDNLKNIDEIINNNGDSTIHIVASLGRLDMLKYLVNKKGANFYTRNCNRMTPLHYAASNGNLDVVEYLIELGTYVDVLEANKFTPLHLAVTQGHLSVAMYLVREKGADVNALDINKYTPLHFAVHKNHQDIVVFLVENKANLDALNTKERTPLHLAVLEGQLGMIKYLVYQCIKRKIDFDFQKDNKKTLLKLAIYKGKQDCAKVLIQGMVKIGKTKPECLQGKDPSTLVPDLSKYWDSCIEEKHTQQNILDKLRKTPSDSLKSELETPKNPSTRVFAVDVMKKSPINFLTTTKKF